MLSKSINELKEKLELRNKILSCCQIVGPIGPRGPRGERGIQGEPGPLIASSNEGIFFTGFADTNVTGEMIIQDPWLIPNPSEYISIISESEIEIEPGIYEITLTGLIENADEDHGAAFYLKNDELRTKIIKNAYAKISSCHTIDIRIKKILDTVKNFI